MDTHIYVCIFFRYKDRNQENVSLKNKIKEMGILNCFKKQGMNSQFGLSLVLNKLSRSRNVVVITKIKNILFLMLWRQKKRSELKFHSQRLFCCYFPCLVLLLGLAFKNLSWCYTYRQVVYICSGMLPNAVLRRKSTAFSVCV